MDKTIFIFDLDGTLYGFGSKNFIESKFYSDIKENIFKFFMKRFSFSRQQAAEEYERIKETYNGEVSIGVETEYDIDRYEYFANTWNLNPEKYIQKNPRLIELFKMLEGRVAILTAAPRVWAEQALRFLEVYGFVENSLFTGEPNTRKPKIEAFQQVVDYFKIIPENAYSVGDQEETDIIPAKKLGMKTIIIGKSSLADFQINSINKLNKLFGRKKL